MDGLQWQIWMIYNDLGVPAFWETSILPGVKSLVSSLVNPKIAAKWMFIALRLTIMGFDQLPYGYESKPQYSNGIIGQLLEIILKLGS